MAFRSVLLLFILLQLSLVLSEVDGTADAPAQEASTVDPLRPDMHLYEAFLKNVTRVAVKKALPSFLRLVERVNMSSRCLSSLLKYAVALKQIRVWAVRMLDATAKVPSGLFDGTVTEFGAFDQCLKILVKSKKGTEDFRGQYCSLEAVPRLGPRPRNLSLSMLPDVKFDDSIMKEIRGTILAFYQLSLRLGVCVPSTCTADDMQVLGAQVAKPLNLRVRVSKCHVSQEVTVEPVHIAVLSCLCFLVIMVTWGTCLHWRQTGLNVEEMKPAETTTSHQIALCFALQDNYRRLVAESSSRGEMQPLHGVRALSMTWVILGHTYIWVNFQALRNSSAASGWFHDLEFEVILNGWLSVSSFVFLSGLLTTHSTLQYLKKTGGKMNLLLYVFRRFSRLYPSLLLLLGSIYFLPWIATGPFWSELPGTEVENCWKSWWANLLFINNWRPMKEMCMQHSWYVSADLQLHIIALIILLPLYRSVPVGLSISALLTTAGCFAVGIITYLNDYDPTILVSTANLPMAYNIVENIHIKTYTYFGPYCVGVVTGYCLMKRPKSKLGTIPRVAGWCCAAVVGLSSLYGTHLWNTGHFPHPQVTATYAALHRTTFALALAWVAFDSISTPTGLVSSVLKFRPFVLLSRLTYMTYLVQGPVIWTRYGSLKERVFYSHFNMLYDYVGNLVLSLAIAFGGNLLVEAPFANLERLLLAPKKEAVLCQVKSIQEVTDQVKKWQEAAHSDKSVT